MDKNQADNKANTDKKPKKKQSKLVDLEQKNGELTLDLQRIRADFENYRKRTEAEVLSARRSGGDAMIIKLLPVIDTLDRAINHAPDELADNAWAKGVTGASKKLEKLLSDMKIERISAKVGEEFNPDYHYAIQYDEESEGDHEVVAEELQTGYTRDGVLLRQSMVRVAKSNDLKTDH